MGLIEGLQAALDYLENPTALTATSVSMCLCWLATYAGMVRKSFQDRSYSMPLMPLCCDIAFEFVFSVLYPPTEAPILQYVFGSWMAGSVMVVFATIRFMPNEWKHAPLVQEGEMLSDNFADNAMNQQFRHLASFRCVSGNGHTTNQ